MQKPIEAFMADDKAWREGLRLADPIPPPPSADAARAAVEVFRPCNPDVATQMAKALDDEEAHAKVLLADETQCRATPSCSAARAAERAAAEAARVAARKAQAAQEAGNAVCYDLSEIQDEKTRIANERTNPSGVMDLQVMHDAGDRLRTDQENLARDKAAYLKATGKPFNLKCVSQ
jgi:hypothetical protein